MLMHCRAFLSVGLAGNVASWPTLLVLPLPSTLSKTPCADGNGASLQHAHIISVCVSCNNTHVHCQSSLVQLLKTMVAGILDWLESHGQLQDSWQGAAACSLRKTDLCLHLQPEDV